METEVVVVERVTYPRSEDSLDKKKCNSETCTGILYTKYFVPKA